MKGKALVLVLLAMAVMVVPALAGEDLQALRVYFANAIETEIMCCESKSCLQSSRSANLRMKGHREASMALFLKSNKEQLIEEMVATGLEPKEYKVHRFLNHQFCQSCYAKWSAEL